jgi:amidophosphoribosyltransferase
MFDKFHDECGVFGVFGHPEAANLTYLGLYALQHRGQESSGICSSDGSHFYIEKSKGLVADVFTRRKMKKLAGSHAIGHNRYSTAGSSATKNAQPLTVNFSFGDLAIAHNGNLTNADEIRKALQQQGAIFLTNSDTEVIVHLISMSKSSDLYERIVEALNTVVGAFSLLLMTNNELIAARDSYGFRPLSLGHYDGSYVVASETCAFDLIGADYIRDIHPGEIVIINNKGITSYNALPKRKKHFCIFEYIYFSRPDSNIFNGTNVNLIRKELGRQLAREIPVDADLVIPVPDSGVPAAIGYADESGLPLDFGLIRNHYVGRTFIEPKQSIRHFGVKIKLNPVRKMLEGKRIVVVDDSLVRGTTSKKIVKMLHEIGGAQEVHFKISSPPIIGPCYYGIDTPIRSELIAYTHSTEEIRKYITCESLDYLSLKGLLKVVPNPEEFCTACFDNNYPILSECQVDNQMKLFM